MIRLTKRIAVTNLLELKSLKIICSKYNGSTSIPMTRSGGVPTACQSCCQAEGKASVFPSGAIKILMDNIARLQARIDPADPDNTVDISIVFETEGGE